MEDNFLNRWFISLSAAIVVAACIVFPPLLLVVIPGWIYLYQQDKKRREGKSDGEGKRGHCREKSCEK